MAPETELVLYELPGCPYCRRVKNTLDELDVAYGSKIVPSAHDERSEVEAISGQTAVPVLVDPANNVEGMAESTEIVAYLEATYGPAE